MDKEQVQSGTVAFAIPSIDTPCSTYYKIIGDLHSGQPAVVVLHGGPGSGHEYMLPFGLLWQRYRVPVVFYDQIGCASSTHLRHTAGDKAFWTIELFIQQLDSLLDALHLRDEGRPGFHILGHSWGGIVATYFATQRPRGLLKLILASAPATTDLHVVGSRICWKELPQEAQQVMEEATRTRNYENQTFKKWEQTFMRTFWCRADPFPPKELEARMRHQADDQTVLTSVYGPAPLECTGSMQGWNCFSALPQITAPTLVYHGEFDIEREVTFAPLLSHIPGVRKATIANASHMAHLDDAETQREVLDLVGTFLLSDGNS